MINHDVDRYAVMGNPIAHSKSPMIHRLFAEQTGEKLRYTAELVEIGHLAEAVEAFQAAGGKGLNITVPFKEDAWQLAHRLSDRAKRAGAVNTLVLKGPGDYYGDTTDGVGLVRDLKDNHGTILQSRRILVIGAGGAVRGVLEPLLLERPALLLISNRTVEKAEQLAEDFGNLGNLGACGFDALKGEQFDILINGTSASLSGERLPLPPGILAAEATAYDMMYGASATPFMRWAHEHGAAQVLDGLGMLVEQAAESFLLWRGIRPSTSPVIEAVRQF